MRNIFDQYRHHENRLTHALVSCLAVDPSLLRRFIKWATGQRAPSGRLTVLEQTLPGEEEPAEEEEAERRGLPDGWIHDGDKWALVIESKIESPLTRDQLHRHKVTAERRGFAKAHLLAFVTDLPKNTTHDGVTIRKWTQLYSWLLQQPKSEWTRRLTTYMEVLETRMVADDYLREGTLTVFSGIPFTSDNPYNYPEAKRLLRLALDNLRTRKELIGELRMNPIGKGRPAITGRDGHRVWDFLPLMDAQSAKTFTKYPHLTLSIQQEQLIVIVTVPNGIHRQFRKNLLASGLDGFRASFSLVLKNLSGALGPVKGAAPLVEIIQRHYPSQRAEPIVDARLQFDLRTGFGNHNAWHKSVKHQPQWLEIAYASLSKKQSNLQLGVGATFRYSDCPTVHTPEILDRIAEVWLACKPLIRTMLT